MRHARLLLLLLSGFVGRVLAQGTDEQLAAQYFQQGDYERAALYYAKLYDQQPSTFNYDQLFTCWMALKNFEEAEKIAKDQSRKQSDPKYLVDLGQVMKARGEPEKADQQFDKALKNLKEDQKSGLHLQLCWLFHKQHSH